MEAILENLKTSLEIRSIHNEFDWCETSFIKPDGTVTGPFKSSSDFSLSTVASIFSKVVFTSHSDYNTPAAIYLEQKLQAKGSNVSYTLSLIDMENNRYVKHVDFRPWGGNPDRDAHGYDIVRTWAPLPDPEPIFVKSISSIGSQYIKTNILPSMNHVIELDVRMDDASDAGVIYGVRQAMGGVQTSLLKYNSDNTFIIQSTNGYKIFSSFKRNEWVHITVDYPNKQVTVNGVTTKLTQFVFGKITNPYYLFAFDKLGSIEFPSIMSIKSFTVKQNDNEILYDLKPCVNPRTNKPAMYDTVNKQYFYNEGTGEFTYEALPQVKFDFSKVETLTIPEGNVKQIAIGGQVVWKMKPQTNQIIVETPNSPALDYIAYKLSQSDPNWIQINRSEWSKPILVPIKAYIKINCYADGRVVGSDHGGKASIYYNGQRVAYKEDSYFGATAIYEFEIVKNIKVNGSPDNLRVASVNITEE